MKGFALAFIAACLAAGVAFAQSPMDPVVNSLMLQGFTGIHVVHIGNAWKVEAVMAGIRREIIYDAQTGKVLSDRVDTNADGVFDHTVGDDSRIFDGQPSSSGSDGRAKSNGGSAQHSGHGSDTGHHSGSDNDNKGGSDND